MAADNEYLLVKPDQKLTCPKCEHEFGLNEGFAKRALEKIEEKSAEALAEREAAIKEDVEKRAKSIASQRDKSSREEVADLKKLLEEQGKKSKEILDAAKASERATAAAREQELLSKLETSAAENIAMRRREEAIEGRERGLDAQIAAAAAEKATELVAADRESYEKRLAERSAQVHVLQAEQVALREERQQLQDQKDALALDVQKQVDAKLQERESFVRNQEAERARFREADLMQTIEGMKGTIADLQRKAEQGSQQIQGEVLELALEDGLRGAFPLDVIEEVKKGQRGGDVIQRVMTRQSQPAGVVLWETKRAKDFSQQWIGKLKEDMRNCGADYGVLVTMPTAIPKEIPDAAPFAAVDDVWVVTWPYSIAFAAVLRAGVLDVHRQRVAVAGKGEKMEAVYDYVTSPQFAQKLRAVFEVFQSQQKELDAERNQTVQRWARREKQLQSGIAQLLGIGGEVQGLAQQALPELEMQSVGVVGEDS